MKSPVDNLVREDFVAVLTGDEGRATARLFGHKVKNAHCRVNVSRERGFTVLMHNEPLRMKILKANSFMAIFPASAYASASAATQHPEHQCKPNFCTALRLANNKRNSPFRLAAKETVTPKGQYVAGASLLRRFLSPLQGDPRISIEVAQKKIGVATKGIAPSRHHLCQHFGGATGGGCCRILEVAARFAPPPNAAEDDLRGLLR
jgi:hypothetical protein